MEAFWSENQNFYADDMKSGGENITEPDKVSKLVTDLFRQKMNCYYENHQVISVPNRVIPKGAKLVECYETDSEYVIIGQPEPDDENHNCDYMGCSTCSHVLMRVGKNRNGC